MTDYLSEVFGPGGVFAARFARYQMRPGQVALARTIDQAMREGRHVLAEGPCGIGKGVGYCTPATYHAHHHKKRVVIATANIALQEQLCVGPREKILTADLLHVPAEEIEAGTRLVAFDEERVGERRRMRTSVVLAVERIRKPTCGLEFDDGTTVVCSHDHLWLCARSDTVQWLAASRMVPATGRRKGSAVIRVTDVWKPPASFVPDSLGTLPTQRRVRLVRKTDLGVQDVISISTTTKTLIVNGLASHNCNKDLPLLAEVLPWTFTFALLKGRGNFACRDAAAEANPRGGLFDANDNDSRQQMEAITAWLERTATGDMSELSFVPLPRVWSRVSVTADECKGDDCRFRDDCFFEKAKAAAADADVIVTNYHLLFAHLALRRVTGQDLVLPPFELVVLDEAHEAVEIARDFFGFSLSEHSVARLARYASDVGKRDLAERLRIEARRVFDQVAAFARSPVYRCRLKRPGFTRVGDLLAALTRLAEHAQGRADDDGLERSVRAAARAASRQATTFASRLADVVAQTDACNVYWIELDHHGRARLRAKPVDVSDLLREELFDKAESVTLISATMTTGGTFEFLRREAGVPDDALEVIAETPFDFERQALLIVPDGLPEPRDPAFIDAAACALQQVIDLCDGRTLGLFTSHRHLGEIHARITGNGHRVLRQGELPRAELVRIFKEDVSSILLGTESLWTGVDVVGEALTAVVIDKLPFPSPDDPIVDAISERDPQAFHKYLMPMMILLLRQGVGRLIRSEGDVGVVVILDRRLAEKGYGRKVLKSLPPMLATRRMANITPFLAEARRARGG